ncbi:hypothetical protein BH10BAC3_BH10BAC3_04740 [soil metagenome]
MGGTANKVPCRFSLPNFQESKPGPAAMEQMAAFARADSSSGLPGAKAFARASYMRPSRSHPALMQNRALTSGDSQ